MTGVAKLFLFQVSFSVQLRTKVKIEQNDYNKLVAHFLFVCNPKCQFLMSNIFEDKQ
jgi:hypothetical protein